MSDRITITLEASKDGPPLAIRMRKLLKFALRSLGLRCVACISENNPPASAGQQLDRSSNA